MISAFWDTSAVVPLCVQQGFSPVALQLSRTYDLIVWWSTRVEVRSALERLVRTGHISIAQRIEAESRLEKLQRRWGELQPTDDLRAQAELYLRQYPLKAADALQLAAAWIWCAGVPKNRVFISADHQLLEAARQVGFQVVSA